MSTSNRRAVARAGLSPLRWLAPLALVMIVAGCGHDIGDNCLTSVDCDPNGSRTCDLSRPGGYCTITPCDGNSCPEDSVCIRTFPTMYLDRVCLPECEDFACSFNGGQDVCGADELCLETGAKREVKDGEEVRVATGVCARRSYEQRGCAKTCGGNDDCRGGYECRDAGKSGATLLAKNPTDKANICAPLP